MQLAAEWSDLAERLMIRLYRTVPAPVIPQDAATIAHHESGHIVAAAALNLSVPTGASIKPIAPGAAGLTWHGDAEPLELSEPLAVQPAPAFADCKLQVFQMAAIRYAGRQAEYLLHQIDPHGLVEGDTHDDLTAAALLSLAFVGADRHSYPRGGCQRFARMILAKHWPSVQAVADALLQHGTLNADQIKQAMDRTDFPPMSRATTARGTSVAIGAQGMAR